VARPPRGADGSAPGTPSPVGIAGRSADPDPPAPSPSPSPAPSPSPSRELRRIRRRIDALDWRIVALLNERAALGLAAGEAKRAAGRRAIRDTERERVVLAQVAAANPGPLSDEELLAIYRRVFSATRRLELAARRSRSSGRQ
jgi:chorismate mutase/prephenate dehydratase